MPVLPPSNAERKFHGTLFDVWQWEQQLYDGTTNIFECVTRPDTAAVLAFLDQKTVLITHQEQPHISTPFISLPGGRVDPGEDIEVAAKRELQEETGYQADRFLTWARNANKGTYRYEEGLFLAADLHNGHPQHLDGGEKITCAPIAWNDLVQTCLKGELRSSFMMLQILQMEFDPESKQRLHEFLRGM